MKIIPFSLPKTTPEAFRLQVDHVPRLYDHLHQHPEIQITLIQESEGTFLAGDYIGRFSAGDIFIICSNLPHVFRNDQQYGKTGLVAKSVSIYFDEHSFGTTFWNLPETKPVLNFLKAQNNTYQLSGTKLYTVRSILEQLPALRGIAKMTAFLAILSHFENHEEIIFLGSTPGQKSFRSYDGDRLNRILEYTFSAYTGPVELTKVASIANLSTEAFCKYFKTRTRKTYFTFINELRIQHARRLLFEGDEAVTSIAYQAGFNNLSHFNRTFRNLTGITPSAYRSKNRGL